MASRVVVPDAITVPISNGDWLLLKKRLNRGEASSSFSRTIRHMSLNGRTEIDPEQLGLSKIVAYLVDWSLKDPAGKVIPVRDQPAEVVESALNSLHQEDFDEIEDAVDKHVKNMEAERAAEKKPQDGETTSSGTSSSPSNVPGATNG